MKTNPILCVGLLALSLVAQPALSKTRLNISVNLGAGRPYYFETAPRVVAIPQSNVRYVRDYSGYDMYQDGNSWYAYDGSRWYRSSSYNGPWGGVELQYVPRTIVTVPTGYAHMSRGRDLRADNGNSYRNNNNRRHGWRDRYGRWHPVRRGRGGDRNDRNDRSDRYDRNDRNNPNYQGNGR